MMRGARYEDKTDALTGDIVRIKDKGFIDTVVHIDHSDTRYPFKTDYHGWQAQSWITFLRRKGEFRVGDKVYHEEHCKEYSVTSMCADVEGGAPSQDYLNRCYPGDKREQCVWLGQHNTIDQCWAPPSDLKLIKPVEDMKSREMSDAAKAVVSEVEANMRRSRLARTAETFEEARGPAEGYTGSDWKPLLEKWSTPGRIKNVMPRVEGKPDLRDEVDHNLYVINGGPRMGAMWGRMESSGANPHHAGKPEADPDEFYHCKCGLYACMCPRR
jgi:hypothetical protein